MKCLNCGGRVDPDWHACPRCGLPLAAVATRWGTTIPAAEIRVTKRGSLGRAIGGMLMVALGVFTLIGAVLVSAVTTLRNPFGSFGPYLTTVCCGLGFVFILVGVAMWHTSR